MQIRVAKPLYAMFDLFNVAHNEWLVERRAVLNCNAAHVCVLDAGFGNLQIRSRSITYTHKIVEILEIVMLLSSQITYDV